MIATNYRKHPDAMALQLVLPFGRALKWQLPRPTTRILRAIRAARGKAFAAKGRTEYPAKRNIPQWWKDAKRAAKALANEVKAALMSIFTTE